MPNLYENSNVVVLKDKDFQPGLKKIKNPNQTIGYLMMYAHWCPHCIKKVDNWKFLADEFSESDKKFKIFAANIEEDVPKAANALNVHGIPTFFEVAEDGSLKKYEGKFSITDLLGNFCKSRNKFCDYQRLCKKNPDFCNA